jgi:signal peptidase II
MALQLGGALGNLIDRVHNVFVVDFIDLKFFPPVFNLADLFIVIGVIIFLFAFWRISPSLENCPW